MLFTTLTAQLVFDRTAPFAPVVNPKLQSRILTAALAVVLTPVARPLNRQRSTCGASKPELVLATIPVFVFVKEQSFTHSAPWVASDDSLIPVVLWFSMKRFSTIRRLALM